MLFVYLVKADTSLGNHKIFSQKELAYNYALGLQIEKFNKLIEISVLQKNPIKDIYLHVFKNIILLENNINFENKFLCLGILYKLVYNDILKNTFHIHSNNKLNERDYCHEITVEETTLNL